MEIVLIWVFLSFLVAIYAGRLKRSGFSWFLVSIVLSPLLAALALLAYGPNAKAAEKDQHVSCPYCKEKILAGAIKCKHCGSELTAEQTKPSDQDGAYTAGQGLARAATANPILTLVIVVAVALIGVMVAAS